MGNFFQNLEIKCEDSSPQPHQTLLLDLHRAAENGFDNEIINIGSPSWNYQIKDLAYAVKDILGQKLKLKINSNAIPDKRSYRVAFDKFYDLAPFELTPQITLNESVNRMVTALLPYKERLARTERGHLIRLNILKNLKERKILSDNLCWL